MIWNIPNNLRFVITVENTFSIMENDEYTVRIVELDLLTRNKEKNDGDSNFPKIKFNYKRLFSNYFFVQILNCSKNYRY